MLIFRFRPLPLCLVLLFSAGTLIPAHADMVPSEHQRTVLTLEQAVKNDPLNSELWLHLGFAYRKAGDIEKSRTAFEKASSLNPRSADAFYMLGLIYESKHQTAEAEKAWQSYLSIETDTTKRAVAEKHIHHLDQ